MRRRSFLAGAVGSTASGAIGSTSLAGEARPWTIACAHGAEPDGIHELFDRAAAIIDTMSAGRLAVRVVPEDRYANTALEALADGEIDAYYSGGDAAPLRLPLLRLATGLPYGLDPARQRLWLSDAGTIAAYERLLGPSGVRFAVLGCYDVALGCWASRELRGANDLRGLRIAARARTRELLGGLGAHVVEVPWQDVTARLARGELDACESRGAILDERAAVFRVTPVCHRLWPSEGAVAALLWTGARTRDRLDERSRAMLESAFALASREFFGALRHRQLQAASRLSRAGAVFVDTSRPIVDLAYAAAQEWIGTLGAGEAEGSALIASWRAWRDEGLDAFVEGSEAMRRYMAAR